MEEQPGSVSDVDRGSSEATPESREAKRNSLAGPGPRVADPLASANELWGPRSMPHPEMLPPFRLSRKLGTGKPGAWGFSQHESVNAS